MISTRLSRHVGLFLGLAALCGFSAPAQAAMHLPLMTGTVTGQMHEVAPRRGESISWVAVRYGVHPAHIGRSGYGLKVDSRRVNPRLGPEVSGLVLNVPECTVYLVANGEVIKDYPVAVSAPDKPVPLGVTQVVSMQKNPTWFVPPSIQKEMASRGQVVKTQVAPGPRNPLGPRWIGFWNGTFGMHGTNVPTSIKRYASHGCVRFRAEDIKDLYERVSIGTPIRVIYQPVLMAVDTDTVWLSVYPDIYRHRFDYRSAVRTLAAQANAAEAINWSAVERAFGNKNGILANVGAGGLSQPSQPYYQAPPPEPEAYVPPDPGLTPNDLEGIPPGWIQDDQPQGDPWFTGP